jgi:hypothetical protein
MQQYKWYSNTHEEISRLAVDSMPPFFKKLVFDPTRRGYFVLGVIAPDRLFCDFTNHYFNCTPTSNGRYYGKVHEKVEKEAKLIREMLDNTDEVRLHPKADMFFHNIIDTPAKAVAFELGVISHYIADAHQPFHTDGGSRYPNTKFNEVPIHRAYEEDVRNNLDGLSSNYESSDISKSSPKEIPNVRKFMRDILQAHNKYYNGLFNAYYPLSEHDKNMRFEEVLDLTRVCFNNAVYNVRSVWSMFDDIEEKLYENVRMEKTLNDLKRELDKKNSYKIKAYKNGNIKLIGESG